MEKHDIPEQGTPEWLEWRRTKVTATDLPAILGDSKWDSAFTLWQRKLGFLPPKEVNHAMQRGTFLEDSVRQQINAQADLNFVPKVVVHKELPWATASLDGYAVCKVQGPLTLEIKCPNIRDHQDAQQGKIPPHYKAQVHWQMFCADVENGLYVSHHDGRTISFFVPRDDEYILSTLLPAATEFYRCLVEMEAPPKTEDDILQIDSPEFDHAAREWKAAHEMTVFYTAKEEFFKGKLVALSDDSNVTGGGVTLTRVHRDGSIDYKTLLDDLKSENPELYEQFSPEKYRKPQIGYWKVSENKK